MFQVNPLLGIKHQALFSSKDKRKKLKCRLLQFLIGALRVKVKSVIPHLDLLTLKAPITTAADDIHKYFSLFFRENKT